MRHDDFNPIWFNFGNLGYPGWTPVSTFESRLILQGAQDLVDNNPKEACEHMIARTRNTLLSAAINSDVNEHWVSQALLVTAMQGLLGHEIPETKTWDDDEYD